MPNSMRKDLGIRPGRIAAGVLSGALLFVFLAAGIFFYFMNWRQEELFRIADPGSDREVTVCQQGQPFFRGEAKLILRLLDGSEETALAKAVLRTGGAVPDREKVQAVVWTEAGAELQLTGADGETLAVVLTPERQSGE